MYCSQCGSSKNDNLNYCNICGGKLTNEKSDSLKNILILLIVSCSVISIVGLFLVAILVSDMMARGMNVGTITILAFGFLVTLISIIFALGRPISKIIDNKLQSEKLIGSEIRTISPSKPNELREFREPISVTENTTRTLEETLLRR